MERFLAGNFLVLALAIVLGLLAAIWIALEAGFRLRRRHRGEQGAVEGLGALEGGVFGLMGLLLAFSFSGAASRFVDRRDLIIEEANIISTAWLRLDLLPDSVQPAIKASFRGYVDARIEAYRLIPDYEAAMAALARADSMQDVIWRQAVDAARGGWVPAATLVLPSLNEMFDITTTRRYAAMNHPPLVLYGLLIVLVLMGSLLAGYDMAGTARRRWPHVFAFVVMVTLTVWIIFDLEYPRLGFIRVDDFDQAIVEVRAGMNP